MTNEQLWTFEGFILPESEWLNTGYWSIEQLKEYATRVRVKKTQPTHHVISRKNIERIVTWFEHASKNLSVDLTVDDYRLNVELLKMLEGVS